jgi:hydrogenase expression/formation protein HypE
MTALACPIPLDRYPNVVVAHGGGGRLMRDLIEKIFFEAFDNPELRRAHDGAVFPALPGRLAFTTDSYVVSPLFFPGGDIGSLAIHGAVNDLAMCGARPVWLSAAFVIEEGLPMETLWRIVSSMADAARGSEVRIVTGDTKVVDRGKGDGVFITTSAIGVVEHDGAITPEHIVPGDVILLSGDIGRHGIAIMSAREGLSFEGAPESDSQSLYQPVRELLDLGITIHCLRDLTRGGLATALVEIAESAHARLAIEERAVPVLDSVRGASEILGLDPLYVANEGRFIAFVPESDAEKAMNLLRGHEPSAGIIGRVEERSAPRVTLRGPIGTRRVIDMLSGDQLPRIC